MGKKEGEAAADENPMSFGAGRYPATPPQTPQDFQTASNRTGAEEILIPDCSLPRHPYISFR